MLKKSLLLGVLLVVFLLSGLTIQCAAQDENDEPFTVEEVSCDLVYFQRSLAALRSGSGAAMRGETLYAHYMTLSYNIIYQNWVTGLNIVSLNSSTNTDSLQFVFVSHGEMYAATEIELVPGMTDFTFVVDEILPEGKAFQTPTTLFIYAKKYPFVVSQFVMNGVGFGCQTFNSIER